MNLYTAAFYGQEDKVRLLLEKGADVNAQGDFSENALRAAAFEGHLEIYGNALYAAVSQGHHEIVKLLLKEGADITAQGGKHGNALQAAAFQGHPEIVNLLLQKGADVNVQGGRYGNALQAAASEGTLEIIELLLQKDTDVNVQGDHHGNALQAAAFRGHLEIVKLLLQKGADVNVQGGHYGNALQAAAFRGHLEIVKLLLKEGADVNAQGGQHRTALHAAVSREHPEIMELLLERVVDINSRIGGEGRTPLHLAVEIGSESAVTKLLHQGALTNSRDFGDLTPLQLAAQQQDFRIARLLLSRTTDSLSLVKASKWRTMLPSGPGDLEMATDDTTTITKTPESDIRARGYPLSLDVKKCAARFDNFMGTDIGSRRIFILDDGHLLSSSLTGFHCRWWRLRQQQSSDGRFLNLLWRVQPNEAPSRAALAQIPKETCFVECRFATRAITLPISPSDNWPTFSDTSKLNIEGFEKTYGILWIMTKRQDTTTSESTLESRIFFSTSEYAQVPPDAIDLFAPLVQQLRQEWDLTFQAAELRLAMKRTELLRANGRSPRLIRDLLGDAQLWDLLRRSCSNQIDELMEFRNS